MGSDEWVKTQFQYLTAALQQVALLLNEFALDSTEALQVKHLKEISAMQETQKYDKQLATVYALGCKTVNNVKMSVEYCDVMQKIR